MPLIGPIRLNVDRIQPPAETPCLHCTYFFCTTQRALAALLREGFYTATSTTHSTARITTHLEFNTFKLKFINFKAYGVKITNARSHAVRFELVRRARNSGVCHSRADRRVGRSRL